MVHNSISRLFLSLIVIQLSLNSVVVAWPTGERKDRSVAGSSQGQPYNKGVPASSKNTPAPEGNRLWDNPLVKVGAVVAFLYGGGFIIAASIWGQLKNLFPDDGPEKQGDDDNDCGE